MAMVEAEQKLRLRDMTWIRSSYIIPRHDFVKEALIPCLEAADHYRCMAGFFDSGALRDIAPGLAQFISTPGRVMKLIASPYIDDDDQQAIRTGLRTSAAVLEKKLLDLCGTATVGESALANHTLDCLAYLLASKRLLMKISFVPGGLFHPKVWILDQDDDVIVLHGSSNLTTPGLRRNVEQLTVSRSWSGERSQLEQVGELTDEFEALWHRQRSYAEVMDLPVALERELLRRMPPSKPTSEQFWDAWQSDRARGFVDTAPQSDVAESRRNYQVSVEEVRRFEIPRFLDYSSGDFAHQGRAVDAWEAAGRRGIIEMATGSGKTVTALVGAQRLYEEKGQLLLVIAAPYLPLIEQWRAEAKTFGLNPIVPNDKSGRRNKLAEVEGAVRRLNNAISTVETVIVSHDLICDSDFQAILECCKCTSLLIGDEAHNLGRDSFVNHPPESFLARMALSATPVRQYDSEGTEALVQYFGRVAFEFTLKDAIGICLVPYEYFIHRIGLTDMEAHKYGELTRRLSRLGWTGNNSEIDDQVQRLLIRRRGVLEQAGGKLSALADLLRNVGPQHLHHSLIYASAKGHGQIDSINKMLSGMGIYFHQITAEETSQPRLAGEVLNAFASGRLQVLTAMKVLDEGVNIPEIETAYIIASTSVQREWVQRRGRVLRKCKAINKSLAKIHDFVVLPSCPGDADTRGVLRGELVRVREFAGLAANAGAPDGAYRVIQDIINSYFV